jgi:hypothetical protein
MCVVCADLRVRKARAWVTSPHMKVHRPWQRLVAYAESETVRPRTGWVESRVARTSGAPARTLSPFIQSLVTGSEDRVANGRHVLLSRSETPSPVPVTWSPKSRDIVAKAELHVPNARRRGRQQCVLGDGAGRKRYEFNHVRPHEALDMETPASRHKLSPRRYEEKVGDPEYPGHFETRRVKPSGAIRMREEPIVLSAVLQRECVGLEPNECDR